MIPVIIPSATPRNNIPEKRKIFLLLFALTFLFFQEGLEAISPKLRLFSLVKWEAVRQDFEVYYKVFSVTMFFRLLLLEFIL